MRRSLFISVQATQPTEPVILRVDWSHWR